MKTRHFPGSVLVALCLLAGGLSPAQAEPAVYRNGELSISAGIVQLQGKDHYYSDILLRSQSDGTLKIARARKRTLAGIEDLELDQVYGDGVSVELYVAGYTSTPCVALEPVAISREGNTWHVLIAETPPDPLALCIQVLQPFELTVQLDTSDAAPGDYVVLVNNEPMEFTIEDFGA